MLSIAGVSFFIAFINAYSVGAGSFEELAIWAKIALIPFHLVIAIFTVQYLIIPLIKSILKLFK